MKGDPVTNDFCPRCWETREGCDKCGKCGTVLAEGPPNDWLTTQCLNCGNGAVFTIPEYWVRPEVNKRCKCGYLVSVADIEDHMIKHYGVIPNWCGDGVWTRNILKPWAKKNTKKIAGMVAALALMFFPWLALRLGILALAGYGAWRLYGDCKGRVWKFVEGWKP